MSTLEPGTSWMKFMCTLIKISPWNIHPDALPTLRHILTVYQNNENVISRTRTAGTDQGLGWPFLQPPPLSHSFSLLLSTLHSSEHAIITKKIPVLTSGTELCACSHIRLFIKSPASDYLVWPQSSSISVEGSSALRANCSCFATGWLAQHRHHLPRSACTINIPMMHWLCGHSGDLCAGRYLSAWIRQSTDFRLVPTGLSTRNKAHSCDTGIKLILISNSGWWSERRLSGRTQHLCAYTLSLNKDIITIFFNSSFLIFKIIIDFFFFFEAERNSKGKGDIQEKRQRFLHFLRGQLEYYSHFFFLLRRFPATMQYNKTT